jgi:allene oxide cyclase
MKLQALASVMFVGAVLFAGAAKQEGGTTIKVVERATTDVVTDLATEGDSVGDILTFANEVYDEANAEKVGTDNGYCVRTAAGAAWECIWTLTLAGGQIMVEGPFLDSGDSVLAITGGTGDYHDARGQMNLHWRNPEGTEYDFEYVISP